MTPGIARRVLERFQKVPADKMSEYKLSKRETEVVTLLAKGYTYKRIAQDTFISIDTVRGHLKNIYTKLQVNSGREAVAMVLKNKLIDLDDFDS